LAVKSTQLYLHEIVVNVVANVPYYANANVYLANSNQSNGPFDLNQ